MHSANDSNLQGEQREARSLDSLKELDLGNKPRQLSILAVDDEAEVRYSLALLLGFDKHKVTSADCAQTALELLESNTFDLVITDYRMPGMNGDELARLIKQRYPTLPVVMLSGFVPQPIGPLNPVEEILEKPCTLAELRRVLASRAAPQQTGQS